ncbi:MAG TPA: CRTAC1 family protein [Armatimonadota bacterium]|nr:CRTAC1 family protein [Armatimonadota bacterium]
MAIRFAPVLVALSVSLPGCQAKFGAGAVTSPQPVAPPPLFAEVAQASGVRFNHSVGGNLERGLTIVQTTGAGCAILDFDNDGLNDLFLVQGAETGGNGHRLYRNEGGEKFRDVTQSAGIKGPGKQFGMGVAAGDYNADGWTDLYVMCWGDNTLYRNNGNGTFTDTTAAAGVRGGGFSSCAVFADFDEDGDADLFVARYCEFGPQNRQRCQQSGIPTSCPPYFYTPQSDLYYRNNGDGTFEEQAKAAGIVDSTGRGLGVLAFDYNGDRHLDLFVANDGSPNFLFAGNGKGQFKEVGTLEGVGFSQTGTAQGNMGCDVADIHNNRTQSIVVGVFQNETTPLFHFLPAGGSEEIARQSGVAELTNRILTFGIGFADLDNDGWQDIFSANGHVHNFVDKVEAGLTWEQPRQFLRNTGDGKYADQSAQGGPAVTQPAVGRGLAFGDLDNDGDVDMLVNNCSGPAMVIRNDHPPQHWLRLRLLSKAPRGYAEGTEVVLQSGDLQQRAVQKSCYSFASANEPIVHFGLGARTQVDRVEIRWRNGETQVLENLAVDKEHVIRQKGAPALPTAKAPAAAP